MASYQKYQTKKGERWMVQIVVGINPVTGKPKKTTRRGFMRKKDAEEVALRLEIDLLQGTFNKTEMTFEEVYKEWFLVHSKTLKPSTKYAKEKKFKKRILPSFAKLKIKDITSGYCQKYINELAEELKSFRDYAVQLKLVFKYALGKGYIHKNPMDHMIFPTTKDDETDEIKFWTREQMNYFLKRCKDDMSFKDYAIFHLLLFTGIRKGELIALEEKDVIVEKRTLVINKTLVWLESEWVQMKPKTKSGQREIIMDEATLKILRKLMLLNKEQRLLMKRSKDEKQFLFTRDDLRPLRSAYPNNVFDAACVKYKKKLPIIPVHGLRHTHASMLFAAGARMKDVQVRLGHARLETTMNIYTHVVPQNEEDTSTLLTKYMGG